LNTTATRKTSSWNTNPESRLSAPLPKNGWIGADRRGSLKRPRVAK
jgi:hypothetical protein